mmetsp:Transcript_12362/g.24603  ORF Transcript_12362/g.24603 Transcript_12362/m.24603 type:complete len:222 (+) Transcript_12362:5845-6510(+)
MWIIFASFQVIVVAADGVLTGFRPIQWALPKSLGFPDKINFHLVVLLSTDGRNGASHQDQDQQTSPRTPPALFAHPRAFRVKLRARNSSAGAFATRLPLTFFRQQRSFLVILLNTNTSGFSPPQPLGNIVLTLPQPPHGLPLTQQTIRSSGRSVVSQIIIQIFHFLHIHSVAKNNPQVLVEQPGSKLVEQQKGETPTSPADQAKPRDTSLVTLHLGCKLPG